MSKLFGVLFIPSQRMPMHPWVLLEEADPKWRKRGRYQYKEEAMEAARYWMQPGDSVHYLYDDGTDAV